MVNAPPQRERERAKAKQPATTHHHHQMFYVAVVPGPPMNVSLKARSLENLGLLEEHRRLRRRGSESTEGEKRRAERSM